MNFIFFLIIPQELCDVQNRRAKHNLRIGISQSRQPLAAAVASAIADNEFMLCWLFRLPIGKQAIAYLVIANFLGCFCVWVGNQKIRKN
ncbi:MAG: hypothetical protein LBU34_17225 [Planctomycetaceae bacterium]|jgi:hypothetical protein|nr:hypothetical protein [Planctomycetaceae bacterium]